MDADLTPLGSAIWTMAPSSSGPGLLVLIQAIAGSNPAGVTRNKKKSSAGVLVFIF